MKLGFIGVDMSILKTVGIGAVLIQNRCLKCLFMIIRLVYDVPLLLHDQYEPYFLKQYKFRAVC
jgi:hypothetical protein